MSYFGQYTVTFGSTDVTSQVINASVRVGRQKLTDRFTPDIAEIVLIPAPGFTAPNMGDELILTVSGGVRRAYWGTIVDVRRDYGIPYNSGTGAAWEDRVIVRAESMGLSIAGRAQCQAVTINAGDMFHTAVVALRDNVTTSSVLNFVWLDQQVDAKFPQQGQTYTGNFLDYLNAAIIGGAGYIIDLPRASASTVAWLAFSSVGTMAYFNLVNFTDTGSQSSVSHTYKYDQIEFLSSVDNKYTQVQIAYNNSTGTATANTGAQPFTNYSTTSTLQLSGGATDTANIYLKELSQTTPLPFRISTSSAVTSTFDIFSQLAASQSLVGTLVKVTFRETTYNAICEGFTVTQDLNEARYSFWFSPAIGQPLVLTSPELGILNTNILGLG